MNWKAFRRQLVYALARQPIPRELQRPALPVQPEHLGHCWRCWTPPGCEHELSCDTVSTELAAEYIRSVSGGAQ